MEQKKASSLAHISVLQNKNLKSVRRPLKKRVHPRQVVYYSSIRIHVCGLLDNLKGMVWLLALIFNLMTVVVEEVVLVVVAKKKEKKIMVLILVVLMIAATTR